MILNCVIIDDEPLAAGLLASYAEKTSFLNVIGTYNSAIDSIKILREKQVDLLFLDIQMPELSGLEFATIVSDNTKIVFTTAFSKYAVDGYKVNAIDYLLKPISYEAFMQAANKALDLCVVEEKKRKAANDRFFFVKSDYKLVRINFDDILYIMGDKDYVKFCLADGEVVSSLMNIKKLDGFLPRPEFLRVHRSYIVHISKADMIDRSNVVFGDTFIPITGSYKEAVQEFVNGHTPV